MGPPHQIKGTPAVVAAENSACVTAHLIVLNFFYTREQHRYQGGTSVCAFTHPVSRVNRVSHWGEQAAPKSSTVAPFNAVSFATGAVYITPQA